MSREVIHTPVRSEGEDYESRKRPLTELVQAARAYDRVSHRTAQPSLDSIRARLVNHDTLAEFEAASERKRMFGWFERRRKTPASGSSGTSITILPASAILAGGRQ